MARDITNSDLYIDSRDVIKRIAELESDKDDARTNLEEAKAALADAERAYSEAADDDRKAGELGDAVTDAKAEVEHAQAAVNEWEKGHESESWESRDLRALLALQEEAEGYSDWAHGATLILDSEFENYARQTAEDTGAIGRDPPWPVCHIDWAAAADALKEDYTSVGYDGETYWVRS